ncbi:mitochondrial 54S ribosomal protein uL16m [Ascoidea rubescens DSM 1968]|uniref:Mitochondrial ribosomal protein of the large subunit n=1 Tax=Ascoidea rubescens DSM 1968 TaxID=1344418 RepID=A0A1D2VJY4_9ASCO|nr:mitochondrial ribosomal protein of the large subunit [Ascoidea rubescens DSM 1968]ODV61913.1 mitochondrial ribosomal protein of the large subunit [Ascoidea rubescens DSM 1968]
MFLGLRPSIVGYGSLGLSKLNQFITKRLGHEYAPRFKRVRKGHKGRVPVRTGGSIKGSTIVFGSYGLRLKSEGVRLSAKQLQEADVVIMRAMRPISGKLYKRFVCSVPVCVKGNETRMGKGKGAFDHWAARVPTGKVLFEIDAPNLHERVARDTLRKAAQKLSGVYETVTKTDLPRVSLHRTIPVPPKENVVSKMIANPSKELKNILEGKKREYKLYRGW